jgi:ABC-type uncharacterized transport system permease subunit
VRCCGGALESSAQILDLNDIPKETVTIMQGTTVLAVVIAYELTTRLTRPGAAEGASARRPGPSRFPHRGVGTGRTEA